jgi:hypothetical protein
MFPQDSAKPFHRPKLKFRAKPEHVYFFREKILSTCMHKHPQHPWVRSPSSWAGWTVPRYMCWRGATHLTPSPDHIWKCIKHLLSLWFLSKSASPGIPLLCPPAISTSCSGSQNQRIQGLIREEPYFGELPQDGKELENCSWKEFWRLTFSFYDKETSPGLAEWLKW